MSERIALRGAMLSDVGLVRTLNEDIVVYTAGGLATLDGAADVLALVADGMGGHAAGEVASALAAESIRRGYFATPGEPGARLKASFDNANQAILSHSSENPQCEGMGTTCTALAFLQDGMVWVAHIGDSRAYRWRGGALTQLTEDQTLRAAMVRDGLMTREEAAQKVSGNVILEALGVREELNPQIFALDGRAEPFDVFLLCSDGLTDFVDDAAISDVCRRVSAQEVGPEAGCRALVDDALRAGGGDNVSVGLFVVQRPAPQSLEAQAETRPIDIVAALGETRPIRRHSRLTTLLRKAFWREPSAPGARFQTN